MNYCLQNYQVNMLNQWLDLFKNNNITYQARLNLLYCYCKDIDRLTYLSEYENIDYNLIRINDNWVPNEDCYLFTIQEAQYFYMICNNEALINEDFKELFNRALKLVPSQKQKKRRLKRFIEKYCFLKDRFCYFITYTFSDQELLKKEATRKKQAIKFLKGLPSVKAFALNIDFGDLNEREHYHIILSSLQKLDYSLYSSNIDFELCNTQTKDKEAISKYIAKLSNHSVKTSTRYTKIYYFRGKNGS